MAKLSKQKIVDKYIGIMINYLLIPLKYLKLKSQKNKTIIIYKLDGIGDAILSLPMIKHLKEQTNYKIIVACSNLNRVIFENHKFIDKIVVFDSSKFNPKDLINNIKILRREKAMISIDTSQSSNISAIISFLTSYNSIGFKKTKYKSRNYVYNYSIELNPNKHMIYNYFDLLKPLNIPYPRKIELIRLPSKNIKGKKVICIHPCTIITQKKWVQSKWVEIINYLTKDNEVIIIGSKEESILIKELLKKVKTKRLMDLSGRINLEELINLMSKVKLFVGIDGGPAHIAASQGVKVITLFGYENPIRYAPFNNNSIAIYKNMSCSPCIKAYNNEWPTCTNNLCMKNISTEDVIKAIKRLI